MKRKYVMHILLMNMLLASLCAQKACDLNKVNYDCIAKDFFGQMALKTYTLEQEVAKNSTIEISISDEQKAGDFFLKNLSEKNELYSENENHKYKEKIDFLKNIIQKFYIKNPNCRFKSYELFIVKSNVINAFTVGGKIFFTDTMLDICNKEYLIYILLHEVGHNELKHIHHQIKREKALGGIIGKMVEISTLSLNQFSELEADAFAIDMMKCMGFNPEKGINFYKLLLKNEGKKDNSDLYYIDKLLSTHPLNGERYECLHEHVKSIR
jgi:predicted Zn-dependent protease